MHKSDVSDLRHFFDIDRLMKKPDGVEGIQVPTLEIKKGENVQCCILHKEEEDCPDQKDFRKICHRKQTRFLPTSIGQIDGHSKD